MNDGHFTQRSFELDGGTAVLNFRAERHAARVAGRR
jgi:hypothetical protein